MCCCQIATPASFHLAPHCFPARSVLGSVCDLISSGERGPGNAKRRTASVDQTRALIQRAQALGDTLDDPLLLLSVLYGSWNASYIAFNGDALRELSAQILTLAGEQGTIVPLMVGHRLMAMSLLHTGDIAAARAHFDRAIALYDPVEHRALATRFGQDVRVAILSFRSFGCSAIPRPRWQTQIKRLAMRAKSAKLAP
jgi:hypothetical protein